MIWLPAVAISTGCAVHTGPRSIDFALDTPAVLGTELGTFKLQDGSGGTLRSYNGKRGTEFSVKLEKYLKVIDLGSAERMRLLRVEQLEGRTVVVISRTERNCVKATLLAIKDSEVLHWTVTYPECHTEPELQVDGGRLYLAYPGVRFAYQSDSLTKELIPIARPNLEPVPELPNRVAPPAMPARARAATLPTSAAPAVQAGKPQARPGPRSSGPTQASPPLPAKPLDFPQQSQKPVRIILD